jgi:hypothetical protein
MTVGMDWVVQIHGHVEPILAKAVDRLARQR